MKKLNLNKEVIAKLNDDSMNRVEGGQNVQTYYEKFFCASAQDGESYCFCLDSAYTRCSPEA